MTTSPITKIVGTMLYSNQNCGSAGAWAVQIEIATYQINNPIKIRLFR